MEFSYIVMPTAVSLNDNLNPFDKLLYANVFSLTKQEGYCWATNKHLATLSCGSVANVKKSLKKLKELNYLIVETDNKKPLRLRRKIMINYRIL